MSEIQSNRAENSPRAPGFYPPHTHPARPVYQKPKRTPPWNIWEALAVVLLFAGSQPLLALAISAVAGRWLRSLIASHGEGILLAVVIPLVIVCSHILGWGGAYLLVRGRHRLGFLAGLALDSVRGSRLYRVFLSGMGLQVLGMGLALFIPPPEDYASPILRFLVLGGWAVVALFVMAVVLAPLLEEVLFRGLLFPALRARWSFLPSALLVTVLFAGLHAVQTGGYWPALGVIGLCGFALAWLRERTGSLWPSIAFHTGFNFTALLPVLLLGGKLPEGLPGWLF